MYDKDKKSLKYDIYFLLLIITLILITGHTERRNGRIEMCNEIGMKYLVDNKCITIEEYNQLNGQPNYMQIFNSNGGKNASILQLK